MRTFNIHRQKMIMKKEMTPKIILERGDDKGWRLTHGPLVLWRGNRVSCKRIAANLCRQEGCRSWFNRKENGQLVEVSI